MPSEGDDRGLPEAEVSSIEPLAATAGPRDSRNGSRVLGELRGARNGNGPDEAALTIHLAELSSRLRRELRMLGARELLPLCDAMIEVSEVRDEMLERRRDGLRAVQTALSSLCATESVDAVLARGTAAVCDSCGFDRAALSRIEDSRLAVQSVSIPRDPALAAEILALGQTVRPKLDHLLVETDMMPECRPLLVLDAQHHPRANREFMVLSRSTAYVAAPIVSEGDVVGFLHADLYYSAREPDELDRDRLSAFAEGFGHTIGRAALRERLRRQQSDIAHLVTTIEALCADDETEVEIRFEKQRHPAATTGADVSTPGSPQPTEALTPREREVLELMTQGATNGVIGAELVISAGTVKSHVGHILRKLNAGNRAEAVSRYLRAS